MIVFSAKFGGVTSFGGTIGGNSKHSMKIFSRTIDLPPIYEIFSLLKVSCYTVPIWKGVNLLEFIFVCYS